jgi:drug/metabolite transporter (DMT)-like permease
VVLLLCDAIDIQVISIALSYILLAKPFTTAHFIGGSLFVASIVIGARSKMNRAKEAEPG